MNNRKQSDFSLCDNCCYPLWYHSVAPKCCDGFKFRTNLEYLEYKYETSS